MVWIQSLPSLKPVAIPRLKSPAWPTTHQGREKKERGGERKKEGRERERKKKGRERREKKEREGEREKKKGREREKKKKGREREKKRKGGREREKEREGEREKKKGREREREKKEREGEREKKKKGKEREGKGKRGKEGERNEREREKLFGFILFLWVPNARLNANCPVFELRSPCPFPTTITVTPRCQLEIVSPNMSNRVLLNTVRSFLHSKGKKKHLVGIYDNLSFPEKR